MQTDSPRAVGEEWGGLPALVSYGMKSMSACAEHAHILGREDDEVYAFFHEALDFLTRPDPSRDALLRQARRYGEVNLKVGEMADGAHGYPGLEKCAHVVNDWGGSGRAGRRSSTRSSADGCDGVAFAVARGSELVRWWTTFPAGLPRWA